MNFSRYLSKELLDFLRDTRITLMFIRNCKREKCNGNLNALEKKSKVDINNWNKSRKESRKFFEDMRNIEHAFSWQKTDEGYEFWRNAHIGFVSYVDMITTNKNESPCSYKIYYDRYNNSKELIALLVEELKESKNKKNSENKLTKFQNYCKNLLMKKTNRRIRRLKGKNKKTKNHE